MLIPGRDSLLLTVGNTSVTSWKVHQAPSRGLVTFSNATTSQAWVVFELGAGSYGVDTVIVEAEGEGDARAQKTIYLTSFTNRYQYHGEVLLDKIRMEFYNGQAGLYAESIRSNGSFIQGTSYLWPASHLLRAFKEASRLNPGKYSNVLKSYAAAIDRYKSTAF
ncbi:MAG: hypothetical protein R6V75_07465, partial [Bacteroidales bacterium]